MKEDKYSGLVIKSVLPNLFGKLEAEANQKRLENKEECIKADKIPVRFDDKEIEFTDELPDDIFHISKGQRDELKSGKAICYVAPTRQITVISNCLSREEEKDLKKIKDIVKKVKGIDNVIFDLYLQWNTFKQMFFSDNPKDNSKPWLNVYPGWFLIAIRTALIDSIFVNLCKIVRTNKEKKDDTKLIIKSLIDSFTHDSKKQKSLMSEYERIEGEINKVIRIHRNKKIAHLDDNFVLGKISLSDVKYKDIDTIISDLEKLFTDISGELTSCTFSYKSAKVEDGMARMKEIMNMGFLVDAYKNYLGDMTCDVNRNSPLFNPEVTNSISNNEHAKWIKDRIDFLTK